MFSLCFFCTFATAFLFVGFVQLVGVFMVLLMVFYSRYFIHLQDEVWLNTSYLEDYSVQSALVILLLQIS